MSGAERALNKRIILIGWPALVLAVTIWACFALSIRLISLSTVNTIDVAIIRFSVPAIILLPFLLTRLSHIRRVPLIPFLMVSAGGGLPFFLIAAWGGHFATASYVGALIAGTTPIAASIINFVINKQLPAFGRLKGLAVILAGVAVLVLSLGVFTGSVLTGITILLFASLFWGSYTIGIRELGVTPLTCLMLVTYPSAIILGFLLLTGLVESHLMQHSFQECLPFILMQGIGVGIFSTIAYAIAIGYLGTLRCATFGSLAPVVATFLAIPFLNEVPSFLTVMGVSIITAGVFYCNRYNQR